MVNNDYFGIALQDGEFTSTKDVIVGRQGEGAVVAAFADTTATLDDFKVIGTAGPKVQTFECCGFTVAIVGGP